MNPFFDSSFLVKLYVSEADSPVAIALANTIHGMPSISTLTDVEMASALLRRDPKFQGPAAYAKYRSNRDRGDYRVVSVESPTYVLACQLVERHAHTCSLRTLDAIQLACALQHGASEFMTMDRDLAEAAKAEGLSVLPVQP